jgi:hypothetical protein
MTDLDDFVLNSLPQDDLIISELTAAIDNVIRLFSAVDFTDKFCWPYRVLDQDAGPDNQPPGQPQQQQNFSQSTTSMILASLLRGKDRAHPQFSSGYPWEHSRFYSPAGPNPALKPRIEEARGALRRAWSSTSRCNASAMDSTDGICTKSTTYGINDIFTISWHLDLFGAEEPSSPFAKENAAIVEDCISKVKLRANAFAHAKSSYLGICQVFHESPATNISEGRVGDSSYILLRFIRCLKAAAKLEGNAGARAAFARAAKRLHSKLHDQLSFAEITDSRFDPAELAYCLEGLLHVTPEQVDGRLMGRTLEVLSKAQQHSAYWRSETPIVVQQRGHVLFPIGVETAHSILNSAALFTLASGDQSLVGRSILPQSHLTILKRYWSWLKSRQTAVKVNNQVLIGWHSEHINDPSLIHTWETSQILEFMLAFRDMLQKHVADQLLTLSRLGVRLSRRKVDWNKVVDEYEPVSKPPNNVYARIGTDFVEHHLHASSHANKPPNWSMLLYGPPGTGKTTIAENLGDCLQVPVITVTVSDFLAEGEARMENRAKNIFNVLERQTNAIILFDEMDQFMLDRNSQLFREQESVFQFLTPGMLTKIARLRHRASVIFIIATNYEERIDAAIKRTGRIDQQYLVLPPDNARRWAILSINSGSVPPLENLEAEKEDLLEASCLLTYTDIKRVIANRPKDVDELKRQLTRAARNIEFNSMRERYRVQSPGLESELMGLISLIDEGQRMIMSQESGKWSGSKEFNEFMSNLPEEFTKARKHFGRLNEKKTDKLMNRKTRGRPKRLTDG